MLAPWRRGGVVVTSIMFTYTMTHQEANDTRATISRVLPIVGSAHNKWIAVSDITERNDVRRNIFEGLSKSLNSYYAVLAPLSGKPCFESLIKLPNASLATNFANEVFTFCKWGYLVNTWVLVEECFRDIAAISTIDPSGKIKHVINAVLKVYECQQFADLVHILRVIRNLQHSNGIYCQPRPEGPYSWNGKMVNFVSGQPAESWVLHEDFLIDEVQRDLVRCFEGIFLHQNVSDMHHIPRRLLLPE